MFGYSSSPNVRFVLNFKFPNKYTKHRFFITSNISLAYRSCLIFNNKSALYLTKFSIKLLN